jgi:hypothetical protein
MKKSRLGGLALRGSLVILALAPLVLLAEGTARADGPSFGPGLQPFIHTDRNGRTLMDVCPDRGPGQRRCYSQRILPHGTPQIVPYLGGGACSSEPSEGTFDPPPGSMAPSDLLARYNIPSTAHANGAIVAVTDLPSTNAFTDVNTYRTTYGIATLPECPTNSMGVPTPGGTACFARVGVDGTINSVSTTDCPGWSGETALDIEMISAVCPDCSIIVAEAPDAFGTDLDQMDVVAATVDFAVAASNSWGSPESGSDDQSFYMNSGMLAIAGSGDSGYLLQLETANTPGFPASSPYVLAVGGTTLFSSTSEIVWNDPGDEFATTSGCSTEFPMPTYQTASGFNYGSCTNRAVADVAAAADFSNGSKGGGIAVFETDAGGWNAFVGTSASGPIVAGILVRLGLAGKDNHPLFYQNGGAFYDITIGNDDPLGGCSGAATVLCTAGPGWDGPTGLGTPNGVSLVAVAGGASFPEPDAGPPDSGAPTCMNNTQCTDPTPICSPSFMCVPCTKDSDCTGNPAGKACASGSCVPCAKNSDCTAPTSECNPLTNECIVPVDGGSDAAAPDASVVDSGSGSHMDSGADTGKLASTVPASSGCSCKTGPSQTGDLAGPMLLGLGLVGVFARRDRARRRRR